MYCKCGTKMGYNTYRKNGVEYAPPKLVCNNQVHCKTGSAIFQDVFDDVRAAIKDCIKDFEVRIKNDKDDSFKLHKDLVNRLEKKMEELEKKELEQWEAQYDPDESKRLPPHIFQKLNEKVLHEKAEITKALDKAKDSIPQPIDYKDELLKFTDALRYLEDPEIPAKVKNQYLKNIIDKIEYERGETVRITKENSAEYNIDTSKGLQWYTPPYKIKLKLKYN